MLLFFVDKSESAVFLCFMVAAEWATTTASPSACTMSIKYDAGFVDGFIFYGGGGGGTFFVFRLSWKVYCRRYSVHISGWVFIKLLQNIKVSAFASVRIRFNISNFSAVQRIVIYIYRERDVVAAVFWLVWAPERRGTVDGVLNGATRVGHGNTVRPQTKRPGRNDGGRGERAWPGGVRHLGSA